MSRDRGAEEHFTPGRPAQPVRRPATDYFDGWSGTRIDSDPTNSRIEVIGLTIQSNGMRIEVHRATHSLEEAEHIAREILSQVAAARGEVQSE